jgi:hypothetical protein
MTRVQQIFAVIASVSILAFIIELVRRRRLKEEYAWLWILTSVGMVVLASWYQLLEWISRRIGAVTVTTTLFIFALLFLLVISVHYSTVISRLSKQVTRLTQELAIVEAERSRDAARRDAPVDPVPTASAEPAAGHDRPVTRSG